VAVTPPDSARYLALYVAEAAEHLEALGRDVVRFEQGATVELVDSMFRHAHSLKGMAATMALEGTEALAHRLEDLLERLRADVHRADATAADVVLQAVDVLFTQVRAAAEGRPLPDAGPVVGRLAALTASLSPGEGPSGAAPGEAQPAPPPAASSLGPEAPTPGRVAVRFHVSPGASQPAVRGFLAYKRLSTLGAVVGLEPALDELKAGRLPPRGIRLELETSAPEAAIVRTLRTVAGVELEAIGPAAAPAPAVATSAGPERVAPPTIRVRAELMDAFLEHAGELLLATARVRALSRGVPEAQRPPIDEALDRLHLLVKGLHDEVMRARMTPVTLITDRLPRAARDIARLRGRDVELVVSGDDVELDRALVDALAEPMMHLLRNAIDHGVEPAEHRRAAGKPPRGRVTVAVSRQRDRVVLEVRDDGRGIDVERLKALVSARGLASPEALRAMSEREALLLVCLPGLSTAADVTQVSGRGVGMDAVKRAVEHVGGTLELESRVGEGTTVRLSMPLTVAVVGLLLVEVAGETYGLPIANVCGVVEVSPGAPAPGQGAPLVAWGQGVVPVHELATLLELPSSQTPAKGSPFVVVEGERARLALAVDRLLGQHEVVLKALARPLDLVPGLAGVTILGDGQPVFILDVARLTPT
jgi:two-component system chemotaxis sensor kinase CheA